MKKMINKLKYKNKYLPIAVYFLISIIGVSFAYVIAQVAGGAQGLFDLTADTTDQLEFKVEPENINLTVNQFTLTEGGGNLSETSVATAKLKANSTKNTATYKYSVYFAIETNTYIYTTEDKKPEIILKVIGPNNEPVTNIGGLTYNSTLQGFDITTNQDYITIAENYSITSDSIENYTIHDWTITVEFINLETNQKDNADKTLNGKVIIQKDSAADLAVSLNNYIQTDPYNSSLSCNYTNSTWNPKYSRIEVPNISAKKANCILTSTQPTDKVYLNEKVMSLVGQTQGNGQVVDEKAKIDNKDAIYETVAMNYTKVSGNDMTISESKYITNATTSQKYTRSEFTPSSNGFYKMCYSIPSSAYTKNNDNYKNKLTTYVLDKGSYLNNIKSNYNNGDTVNGCINYGYVTTSEYIGVETYYYDRNITLWFEKTDDYSEGSIGIRYEGKNPNNYIWFNNELWRIIGVFDDSTHGQSGQKLVKIIREKSVGALAWDKTNNNDWSQSSLKNLLNGAYYNAENGNESGYCYQYSTIISSNCDYRQIGIQSNYRSMIKNVTWHLGGYSDVSSTLEAFYRYERENVVFSGKSTTTAGYIGLIYPSDYGYSVIASANCPRTTGLNSYNKATCGGQSWLRGPSDELTLTPSSLSNNNVFYWGFDFILYEESSSLGFEVRPVLYLDELVFVYSGDGSKANPYIIGM